MSIPQPPYYLERPHPFIPSDDSDTQSGYTYCLICGVATRDDKLHIADSDIAPHTFVQSRRWRGCAICGYRRVNMKHPDEKVRECGAERLLEDESIGDKQLRLRCHVDIDMSPTHTHQARVLTRHQDGSPAGVLTITWSGAEA